MSVRLTLDVSDEVNQQLATLAEKIGTTKSDVLRKAIALIAVAADAKERGLKLGLASKGQQLTTEIVGL